MAARTAGAGPASGRTCREPPRSGLGAAVSAWKLGKAHGIPQNQEEEANAGGKGEKDPSPGRRQPCYPGRKLPDRGRGCASQAGASCRLSELGRANTRAWAPDPDPCSKCGHGFPQRTTYLLPSSWVGRAMKVRSPQSTRVWVKGAARGPVDTLRMSPGGEEAVAGREGRWPPPLGQILNPALRKAASHTAHQLPCRLASSGPWSAFSFQTLPSPTSTHIQLVLTPKPRSAQPMRVQLVQKHPTSKKNLAFSPPHKPSDLHYAS